MATAIVVFGMASFYAHFGLGFDEAPADPRLVLLGAIPVLLSLLVVGLLGPALMVWTAASIARMTGRRVTWLPRLVISGGLVWLLIRLGSALPRAPRVPGVTSLVAALVFLMLILLMVLIGFNWDVLPKPGPAKSEAQAARRVNASILAFGAVILLVFGGASALASAVAGYAARSVLAGQEANFLGLEIPAVTVTWIGSGSSPIDKADEVLYLGSRNGTSFLLEVKKPNAVLIRAPAGSVVLSSTPQH
jgi:hypothetical protein